MQGPAADLRPDPNIGILLREPYLALSTELLRRLNALGHRELRAAHLVVFQHIDPAGSRLTDLAAKAQMTKPSMAYLVERLETSGYVTRVADPTDGRSRLVRLTDRGWEEISDALNVLADLEAELAAALGRDRLRTLRELLGDVGAFTAAWRGQPRVRIPRREHSV